MGLNQVPDLPTDVPFCPGLSSVMGEAGVVGVHEFCWVCLLVSSVLFLACLPVFSGAPFLTSVA